MAPRHVSDPSRIFVIHGLAEFLSVIARERILGNNARRSKSTAMNGKRTHCVGCPAGAAMP
jgi:hypothetical protein